jgi:hypothetical protein
MVNPFSGSKEYISMKKKHKIQKAPNFVAIL